MIETIRPTPKSDAARRQHRRVKQALVAGWIHEISARHGTVPARKDAVEAVGVTERPEPERVMA